MLLFYIVLLVVLNKAILYKGFKSIPLDDEEIKAKSSLLIAGNISVFISLFVFIKPFINFITYQINNKDGMFFIFSVCSIIFVLNIVLLLTSYILSKLLSNYLLKVDNAVLLSILWFVISALLVVLTSEFYNQMTSTNAFKIY
jgi:hypothetical protein